MKHCHRSSRRIAHLALALLAPCLVPVGASHARLAATPPAVGPSVERPRGPATTPPGAASSHNRATARKAVEASPGAYWVCIRPEVPGRAPVCLQLSAVREEYPEDRAKMDQAIARAVGDWGAALDLRLTVDHVHDHLAHVDLGCAAGGASITLEATVEAATTPANGASAASRCAAAGPSALGAGIDGSALLQREAWELAEAYVAVAGECKRSRRPPRGRPSVASAPAGAATGADGASASPGKIVRRESDEFSVSRVAFRVLEHLGVVKAKQDDEGNGTIGVRGYCFEDMACAQDSCESRAQAKVLKERLSRAQLPACDTAAMPTPDSGTGCFASKPLDGWTSADTDFAFAQVCKLHQRVASPGPDGTFACRTMARIEQDREICSSPEAMCTDEQGQRPRSGATTPGPRPVPTAR